VGLIGRLKSTVGYGRKVLDSGLEGARSGQEAFLGGKALIPFLSESVRNAWEPAALGACIGMVCSYPSKRPKSIGKRLVFGFLGGAIGCGGVVAWRSRRLAASATSGALKNIGRVRDEHWIEQHPIDYA
jgi:hypothetical protein